jgi:hypothetical protein
LNDWGAIWHERRRLDGKRETDADRENEAWRGLAGNVIYCSAM